MDTKLSLALSAATQTKALEVGDGVLAHAPSVFAEQFGGRPAEIVCDSFTYGFIGEKIEKIFASGGVPLAPAHIFKDARLSTDYRNVCELEEAMRPSDSIAVAVGAGTVNDIVKLASEELGRPYMCVVTAASVDGYTAYGASIVKNGVRRTENCAAPRAVLCDSSIIKCAPISLTAAGYADLAAKIIAGADWILADALGVEPLDPVAWNIVQDGLKTAISDPAGIRSGNSRVLDSFVEGLMLCGFAMQHYHSSRPASGSEHLFSHLWDMEGLSFNGKPISHGFSVAVGTLAMSALYEEFLKYDMSSIDAKSILKNRPSLESKLSTLDAIFKGRDFLESAKREVSAKYVSDSEFARRVETLLSNWKSIRERISAQLVPYGELRNRLKIVGAPSSPEEIGVSKKLLRDSFFRAAHIRSRYTLLDLAVELNILDPMLDSIFSGVFADL